MNLLISDSSLRVVEKFSESVGAKLARTYGRISVSVPQVSIIVSQPERYSRLIVCEFRFSPDVGFFYEDVCAALSICSAINANCSSADLDQGNEIEKNDRQLINVIEFCKANWAEIIRVPPLWYEKAVEISYEKIRKNFPVIADEDLKNKIRLLNIWRNQSN